MAIPSIIKRRRSAHDGHDGGDGRGLPLGTKLALANAVLLLLVAATLATGMYRELRTAQREAVRARLHDIVALAAAQIDGDFHAAITAPEDADRPHYQIIAGQLADIQGADPEIAQLITLRADASKGLLMVVDTEDHDRRHSVIGQPYPHALSGCRRRRRGRARP